MMKNDDGSQSKQKIKMVNLPHLQFYSLIVENNRKNNRVRVKLNLTVGVRLDFWVFFEFSEVD